MGLKENVILFWAIPVFFFGFIFLIFEVHCSSIDIDRTILVLPQTAQLGILLTLNIIFVEMHLSLGTSLRSLRHDIKLERIGEEKNQCQAGLEPSTYSS